MRLVFNCVECGYQYKAAWYEPNWLAKRVWLPDHESFHAGAIRDDYASQWRDVGRQLERERIIKLLEELKGDQDGCCDECKPHLENSRNYLTAVIALIKGENK